MFLGSTAVLPAYSVSRGHRYRACRSNLLSRPKPLFRMNARNIHRPLEIDVDGRKVTLPKGARCFFSMYWIHHSEINFPRPDEYLPERWVTRLANGDYAARTDSSETIGEVSAPIGDRESNIAFSSGSRNCVGQAFAMRMVPAVLATLLRSFTFRVADPKYSIRLERYGVSQVPIGGIPIIATPRS